MVTQNILRSLSVEVPGEIADDPEGNLLRLGWAVEHLDQIVEAGVLVVMLSRVLEVETLIIESDDLIVQRVFWVHLMRVVEGVLVNILTLNEGSLGV